MIIHQAQLICWDVMQGLKMYPKILLAHQIYSSVDGPELKIEIGPF